jgi:hypothetical protein
MTCVSDYSTGHANCCSLAILRSTHPLLICVLLFDRIYTYIFIIHSHNHNLHTLLESIVFDLGGSGGTVAQWHGGKENFPKIILSTTPRTKNPLFHNLLLLFHYIYFTEKVKVALLESKLRRTGIKLRANEV